MNGPALIALMNRYLIHIIVKTYIWYQAMNAIKAKNMKTKKHPKKEI
jgi:hypothetical protein